MKLLYEIRYNLIFSIAFASGVAIGMGQLPAWVAFISGSGCALLSRWLDPPHLRRGR